jgi:CRP/FNR family nitrogen fixation transcriptional regulator
LRNSFAVHSLVNFCDRSENEKSVGRVYVTIGKAIQRGGNEGEIMLRANHPSETAACSQVSVNDVNAFAVITRYHHDQEISERGKSAQHWHRVVSGAVRQCAVQPDGRRQIVDLLLPGDCFGFPAQDSSFFVTEAIVEGTILASYPRRRVELLADFTAEVAHGIRDGAFDTISRLQRQLLVLGRITASEKVGSFLLEISGRLSNEAADRIALPISRYDIADYLAISVETVSRSLTDLRQRGAIELSGARDVKIVNRQEMDERKKSRKWRFH